MRPMPRNSCSRPSTAPRSSAVACARLPGRLDAGAGLAPAELLVADAVERFAAEPERPDNCRDLRFDGPQVDMIPHGTNGVSAPPGIHPSEGFLPSEGFAPDIPAANPRVAGNPRMVCGSGLHDDGDDHRPAPRAVVDEPPGGPPHVALE